MRVTLTDPSLARQAGRFVWLELNYDLEANQAFFDRHGVAWTPALLVLDPEDERATASHFGGLTVTELNQFLERGGRGFRSREKGTALAALARGDEATGRGQLAEAAEAYREALRTGGPAWAQRTRTLDALAGTLQSLSEWQSCAEAVAGEATGLPRGPTIASVLHVGLGCANAGDEAPWAKAARTTLEPPAREATTIPGVLRDDRFQLYQQLMVAAQLRGDTDDNARWGARWLQEIDGVSPSSDDERSGLDVARVDAVMLLDQPERALAALEASERAMPRNYTASARLAAVAEAARRYDEALAACDRGLALVDGPIGRTGLLLTKARALKGKGDLPRARETAALALQAAGTIGNEHIRGNTVRRVSRLMAQLQPPP